MLLCTEGGVEEGVCWGSAGWVVPGSSSSPLLEEKTRSREGSFSIHSTRDMGRQLNRIWDGWKKKKYICIWLYWLNQKLTKVPYPHLLRTIRIMLLLAQTGEAASADVVTCLYFFLPVHGHRQPHPRGMRNMGKQRTTPERPETPLTDLRSQNG